MTRAVIFDFSGTLFRCEDAESWLRGTLAQVGAAATDAEVATYGALLRESGGQPGGNSAVPVPADLAEPWARRDLDPADHRAAFVGLTRQVDLPWPDLADALYDRHYQPEAWSPYPDTVAVLELLRDRGIPVAVLSNIAWDVRPVFARHGLDDLISAYVLSYQVGCKKPDPRIFQVACQRLGQDPADVLMVGDDLSSDAAATTIGCAFRAVDHLPVDARPRALLDAVSDE